MNINQTKSRYRIRLLEAERRREASNKPIPWATILSIVSLLINVPLALLATTVSYTTQQRAQISDSRVIEAIALSLGDEIRVLAGNARLTGTFLEAFNHEGEIHPSNEKQTELLSLDFIRRDDLPEISLPSGQLTLLARSGNDAASKIAVCAVKRSEIETDFKSISAAKIGKLSTEQKYILKVLPFRLEKLGEACEQAEKSLFSISPTFQMSAEPLRGSLGEIADAQEYRMKKIASGTIGKLTLSAKGPEKINKRP